MGGRNRVKVYVNEYEHHPMNIIIFGTCGICIYGVCLSRQQRLVWYANTFLLFPTIALVFLLEDSNIKGLKWCKCIVCCVYTTYN